MGLFSPAWKSNNKEKALKAIKSIDNPMKLTEIINYPSVKWWAKKAAKDQLQGICNHNWSGCVCGICGKTRDEQHDWDLCKGKCKRCGQKQAEQHDWNHCTCRVCGKTRTHIDPKNRSWYEDAHDWNYCTCRVCGKKGNGHNWEQVSGQCIEKCTVCGTARDYSDGHKWEQVPGHCAEICIVCGEERQIAHTWEENNNCSCKNKCRVCGLEQVKHDANHQWKKVDGECQEVCGICGEKRSPYEIHKWVSMPGCRQKCSVCGRLAYDHDYVVIHQPTGSDFELSGTYKCKKCGHTGRSGGRAEPTTQTGLAE